MDAVESRPTTGADRERVEDAEERVDEQDEGTEEEIAEDTDEEEIDDEGELERGKGGVEVGKEAESPKVGPSPDVVEDPSVARGLDGTRSQREVENPDEVEANEGREEERKADEEGNEVEPAAGRVGAEGSANQGKRNVDITSIVSFESQLMKDTDKPLLRQPMKRLKQRRNGNNQLPLHRQLNSLLHPVIDHLYHSTTWSLSRQLSGHSHNFQVTITTFRSLSQSGQ